MRCTEFVEVLIEQTNFLNNKKRLFKMDSRFCFLTLILIGIPQIVLENLYERFCYHECFLYSNSSKQT